MVYAAVARARLTTPQPAHLGGRRDRDHRSRRRRGGARVAEARGREGARRHARDRRHPRGDALPLLWIGPGTPERRRRGGVRPEGDPDHDALEVVVDVRDEEELELALEQLDPEIFLLVRRASSTSDDDPLDAVLELLPDVPAGKLAIARRRRRVAATRCSRSSAPASTRCSCRAGHVADLVGHAPFDV